MIGIQYKGTFAAKGSNLYDALVEGREADAKRLYAETTARGEALLSGLSVPVVVYELDNDGKQNGKWSIQAKDAVYDKTGRLKEINR